MKEEYISAIVKMVENCQNIELLDFIFQLLKKGR